jgi:uncharacterized membrane protein
MPRFCASCGSSVAEGALACASCGATVGQSVVAGAAAAPATTGLTESLAGALAYVTFLPAIFFLLMDPYNKNRFIRFHSFQCIFLNIAWFVLWYAVSVLRSVPLLGSAAFFFLPFLGFILWIVLIFKAYQGQTFKLPVIGDLAEKQANNA